MQGIQTETNYLKARGGGCVFGGRGNSDKNFTKRGAKAREAWETRERLCNVECDEEMTILSSWKVPEESM